MDIVSVFDTFPFFIHFSSSVFQVAKECFGIVTVLHVAGFVKLKFTMTQLTDD